MTTKTTLAKQDINEPEGLGFRGLGFRTLESKHELLRYC